MNILTTISKNIASSVLLLVALTSPSSATSTCTHSVRECLIMQSHATRASCLSHSAKSVPCLDSPLGAIAALRARVNTLEAGQMIIPVTELGEATTTNSECLRNFDTALASTLIYGEPGDSDLRRLAKTLRFCIEGSSNTSR